MWRRRIHERSGTIRLPLLPGSGWHYHVEIEHIARPPALWHMRDIQPSTLIGRVASRDAISTFSRLVQRRQRRPGRTYWCQRHRVREESRWLLLMSMIIRRTFFNNHTRARLVSTLSIVRYCIVHLPVKSTGKIQGKIIFWCFRSNYYRR